MILKKSKFYSILRYSALNKEVSELQKGWIFKYDKFPEYVFGYYQDNLKVRHVIELSTGRGVPLHEHFETKEEYIEKAGELLEAYGKEKIAKELSKHKNNLNKKLIKEML